MELSILEVSRRVRNRDKALTITEMEDSGVGNGKKIDKTVMENIEILRAKRSKAFGLTG